MTLRARDPSARPTPGGQRTLRAGEPSARAGARADQRSTASLEIRQPPGARPGVQALDSGGLGGAEPPEEGRDYLRIFVTRPAPTVRAPSRMANLSPSCMAMGLMSSTV